MTHQNWLDRAKSVFPAGSYGNYDPSIIIARGQGSRVWDVDGKEYVDLLTSSGPMILGHSHPEVLEAVHSQIDTGQTYFTTNPQGIELAETICDAVNCADLFRYVSTGGEADMYAMRLARAFTGRDKIMKFEGGYHGMSAEAQMSLAPDRLVNFPEAVPDSAGIPQALKNEMLIAPFNDIEFARSLIGEYADQIAAVIVEPLQRLIPPIPGFLQALRAECTKHGIVLIFDEIVTGFRFSYGGAQDLYGVTPDLCTLGKIIGGGFPLAGFAGRADIMSMMDATLAGPDRKLMHSGTLSGNPVAAVAGAKTLEILAREGQYKKLRGFGQAIMDMHAEALTEAGIPHKITGDRTLFDVVFTDADVRDYRSHKSNNVDLYARYSSGMRAAGVLKPVGKMYPSLSLTDADLNTINDAVRTTVKTV